TDVAGLAESVRSLTVNVDTTRPASAASLSGTTGANGWFVSNATVSLSATDAMSGVDHITYRIDGGNWSTYGGSFLLADGQHIVEYLASDLAGLTEAVRSIAVSVDTVAPASVADLSGQSGANGWFVSNVTVAWKPSDAMTGVASLSYRVDGLGWPTYSGPSCSPMAAISSNTSRRTSRASRDRSNPWSSRWTRHLPRPSRRCRGRRGPMVGSSRT